MSDFDDLFHKAVDDLYEKAEKNSEAVQLYSFYSSLAKHMKVGIQAFQDVGFSYDIAYEMVSNIILESLTKSLEAK